MSVEDRNDRVSSMDELTPRATRWQRWHGVVIAALTVILIEALKKAPVPLPNPGSYFALAVAYTAAAGGLIPALVAATVAFLDILIKPTPSERLFYYDHEGFSRILGNCLALYGTAMVVGLLRKRNDDLAGENTRRILEVRTREIETKVAQENEAKLARLAETLQRSLLLTPPEDALPGIMISTVYEPALDEAEVGGDFFDAYPLEGGRVALIVGDVTGKGLVAAARTAEVKFVLRAYLRQGNTSAAEAVAKLNHFLCVASSFGSRDYPEYVCLTLAIVDAATGQVQLVAAGAEPPMLVRADGSIAQAVGSDPDAPGSSPMLGVDADLRFNENRITLGERDALLLLTDGLTEARQSGGKVFFGDTEFAPALRAHIVPLAPEQRGDQALQALTDAAKAFVGGRLRDDVCLLLVRRKP